MRRDFKACSVPMSLLKHFAAEGHANVLPKVVKEFANEVERPNATV